MVVTAFRDVGYTFDNTPWPTHVTLDNFRTVFDTSRGNHFGRALVNSVIIGVGTTVARHDVRRVRRLRAGPAGLPGQVPGARRWCWRLDVPRRGHGDPAVPAVHRHRLARHLPGADHARHLLRPAADGVHPDRFFAEMPWELEQAARVDGCTPGQAFRKVILPLAAPGLFTTAILVFISAWNEYLLASLLSSGKPQPVTVAIADFTGAQPHRSPTPPSWPPGPS